MNLYIVSYLGQDQWLAYEGTEAARIYAYVSNLGRFVFHKPLGQDFHWDRELDWTPVDAQIARRIVTEGVLGRLDDCRHRDFLAKLAAEPDQRSIDDVFGAQPVDERKPSPREQRCCEGQDAGESAAR
ncbi:hypothetical protein AB4Z09_28160 [Rhodococcus sp. TAF43]|uniref:hypothetical protein n=1 Tax=Rhodococcus sp. TAF43 TaxID=3237483 RepID=UPI003F9CA6ED